jgi:hypothetical protein
VSLDLVCKLRLRYAVACCLETEPMLTTIAVKYSVVDPAIGVLE